MDADNRQDLTDLLIVLTDALVDRDGVETTERALRALADEIRDSTDDCDDAIEAAEESEIDDADGPEAVTARPWRDSVAAQCVRDELRASALDEREPDYGDQG